MLLPPRKLPAWLNGAAAQAEREVTATDTENGTAKRSAGPPEGSGGRRSTITKVAGGASGIVDSELGPSRPT